MTSFDWSLMVARGDLAVVDGVAELGEGELLGLRVLAQELRRRRTARSRRGGCSRWWRGRVASRCRAGYRRRAPRRPSCGPSAASPSKTQTYGQVAVLLGDVEAVADDELRRDPEADVAQVVVGLLEALPHEQGAHLEAGGAAGREVLAQVARA